MKIVVLGAGQVGSTVAQNLARESNDVTVVDTNVGTLHELQDRLDLRTVRGVASHPSVLRAAGVEDADMVIAATSSDEVNMMACQIAYTLFHTPTKIARLRSQEYIRESGLFCKEATPIDVVISPERLVTNHIQRIIENPGALQVLDFADGKVRLVAVKAYYGGPMVGHQIRELRDHIPNVDTRVAAIYRDGQAITPTGDTTVLADDEVFFVASRRNTAQVMSEMRRLENPTRRIMIAGGGNIGKALAESLEREYKVKLIEAIPERAAELAEMLDNTLVLQGDAADHDLLIEENIDEMDIFCALTNDDEANILSAMLAKRMGAHKVMSLINRPAYVDLVERDIIDVAVSPQQITIGALLTHVRRGDVVAVHSLRRGAAEAIEAIAHGDEATSAIVGRRIDEIPFPQDVTVGALVRGNDVLIAHDNLVIEAEDHMILFLGDKQKIPEVEKLFQVSVTFI
ncbi:MAG: Trk system potassium transporter TrkA [Pseudomonadota bacterium]